MAHRAQRTERMRVVRTDGDRATRETNRGAETNTNWKEVLELVGKC